jgi:hypothetical protein
LQPWDHPVFGITDENGHLTFERLHEGTITMQTDRGCSAPYFEASVQRGQRTAARFTVPPGNEVRGRVLDPTGRGVGNALVRVTSSMSDGGVVVGRSAPDGSYSVRAVDRACNLFATADGFGGSILQSLMSVEPSSPGLLLTDLSLRGDGGSVEGIVRRPDGEPIFDAWVVIRCAREARRGEALEWPNIWSSTDESGAFRFDGVHVGSVDVFVDADGFAGWTGQVSVEKQGKVTLQVQMDKGLWVEGSVVTKAGTPSADARVTAGASPGSMGYMWRRFRETKTDSKGGFRLGPLPSGNVELHAVQRSRERTSRASADLLGRSGDVLRWDPILEEGPRIVGRVLDDSGRPLEGWDVDASTSAKLEFYPSRAKTDSEGRFVILDCAYVPFRIAAYPPRQPGQKWRPPPGALLENIRPGEDEVLLSVTWESRPSAFLSGRVVDEFEKPLTGAHISAAHRVTGQATGGETSKEDGSFRVGPLPAGSYDVFLDRADLPGLGLDPIEVAPEEERDLGVIQLKPRGRLELVLHREDEALLEHPFLMLLRGRYGIPLQTEDGSTFRSEEIYAGRYTLVPMGGNVATVQQDVEIRAGDTTRLELRLPAGVLQQISFQIPEGETGPRFMKVVARSHDGRVLVNRELWTGFGRDGATQAIFQAGFAPGRYVVEADSEAGWGSTTPLEIGTTTAETKPIEVRLVRKP